MVAIRVTVKIPKKIFNVQDYMDALERAQRVVAGRELLNLFKESVEGWEHQPEFVQKINVSQGTISVSVYATGDNARIYALVSKGSPPHTILPKNYGYLRFQTGYRSATRPGTLRSGPKSRSGQFIRTPVVQHPGFDAREFPKLIREEYQKRFGEVMQSAINEAARR